MTDKIIKLGIVGVGKIVQDQHLPAIDSTDHIELIATASRSGSVPGIPAYLSIEEMLAATPDLDAVALCMPPQYRYAAARVALENGLHTLLEKPPGATVCEVEQLHALAIEKKVCLFTTWHSRHAAAVQAAKHYLHDKQLHSVHLVWKEDVRKWHPGQEWIWQAGGLGVFDPGINGLSILTEILPSPVFVESSRLTFPENKAAPIAAQMDFCGAENLPIKVDFDWRQTDAEQWAISVKTCAGNMQLSSGGAVLEIDGKRVELAEQNEYQSIYAHFVKLVESGVSDVDLTPLKLTADAFLLGERRSTEPFFDQAAD